LRQENQSYKHCDDQYHSFHSIPRIWHPCTNINTLCFWETKISADGFVCSAY
jgi:hypothetical protein